jgi:hypothetical protein
MAFRTAPAPSTRPYPTESRQKNEPGKGGYVRTSGAVARPRRGLCREGNKGCNSTTSRRGEARGGFSNCVQGPGGAGRRHLSKGAGDLFEPGRSVV